MLITRSEDISNVTITYGAVFLGLCVFAPPVHPRAAAGRRPVPVPAGGHARGVRAGEIYRIDPELAREQAQWFVVGLAFFCATIVFLRDHHVLERYRYTIAAVGIALLVMPRLPGIGEQVNGAYLAVEVGPIQFQPAEFAKLAIIVFLASYLRDTGDVLVRARALSRCRGSASCSRTACRRRPRILIVLALGLGTAETVLLVASSSSRSWP